MATGWPPENTRISPGGRKSFIDPRANSATFVRILASLSPVYALRVYAEFGETTTLPRGSAADPASKHRCLFRVIHSARRGGHTKLVPGLGLELAEMYVYAAEFGYFGEAKAGILSMHDVM